MTQPEDVADRMRRVREYITTENAKMPRVDNFGRPVEKEDDAGQADPSGDDPEPPQRRGPAPDRSQGMTGRDTPSDVRKAAIERQTRTLFFAARHGFTFEQAQRQLAAHYR